MKMLKYPPDTNANRDSDVERHIDQLVMLAQALASEVVIRIALKQCGGNQTQAAKLLHLKSTTLNAKMKHYGLNPARVMAN